MDVNAGRIATGEATIDGRRLGTIHTMLDVASGTPQELCRGAAGCTTP